MTILRATFLFTILGIIFCRLCYAGDSLLPGNQYITIQPVYLMAVYDSLNNRKLSKETARAYLHSIEFYNKSEVAFQKKVPTGTTITIISSVPKIWYLPWSAERYFVALRPDMSGGLDVVLSLNRGIEGSLDGLNPELFSRL